MPAVHPNTLTGYFAHWGAQEEAVRRGLASGATAVLDQWNDEAAGAHHVTQATSAKRPTLMDVSGVWFVRGDGTQYLTNSVLADWKFLHDASQQYAILLVYRIRTANPNAVYGLLGSNAASSGQIGINMTYDDRSSVPRQNVVTFQGSKGSSGVPNWTTTSPDNANGQLPDGSETSWIHHAQYISSSLTSAIFIDGVSVVTSARINSPNSTANPSYGLDLMAAGNGVVPANADFAGVVVFKNYNPTSTELANVQLWFEEERLTEDVGGGPVTIEVPFLSSTAVLYAPSVVAGEVVPAPTIYTPLDGATITGLFDISVQPPVFGTPYGWWDPDSTAAADGAALASLPNESGGASALTPFDSNQGQTDHKALYGRKGVTLDATDALRTSAAPGVLSEFTLVLVGRFRNGSGGSSNMSLFGSAQGGDYGATGQWGILRYNTGVGMNASIRNGSNFAQAIGPAYDINPHVFVMRFVGGSATGLRLDVDASTSTASTASIASVNFNTALDFGGVIHLGALTTGASMQLYEAAFYTTALSDADLTTFKADLYEKWNLPTPLIVSRIFYTMPQGDDTHVMGPTIFREETGALRVIAKRGDSHAGTNEHQLVNLRSTDQFATAPTVGTDVSASTTIWGSGEGPAARRLNGDLWMHVRTQDVVSVPSGPITNYSYRSEDEGATWINEGVITLPAGVRWMAFYGSVRLLEDGSWVTPVQGQLTADNATDPLVLATGPWRIWALRSTDEGLTWAIYSTIFYDGTNRFAECDFDQNPVTGLWTAITRNETSSSYRMWRNTSEDLLTWGTATQYADGVLNGHSPRMHYNEQGMLILYYRFVRGNSTTYAAYPPKMQATYSADDGATLKTPFTWHIGGGSQPWDMAYPVWTEEDVTAAGVTNEMLHTAYYRATTNGGDGLGYLYVPASCMLY